jgi:proton-dependent oligopeptide transporter, POT family
MFFLLKKGTNSTSTSNPEGNSVRGRFSKTQTETANSIFPSISQRGSASACWTHNNTSQARKPEVTKSVVVVIADMSDEKERLLTTEKGQITPPSRIYDKHHQKPPLGRDDKSPNSRSPRSPRRRSGSPFPGSSGGDDDLPTNVCTEEQLKEIPAFCLSHNKERPLRHVSEHGEEYHYHLQPMFYSVIFILLVELLERFCFYGINYTQTAYLTGAYDSDWNAGMAPVKASSLVSISTAVAYTMPFVGAYLADSLLGEYWSLIVGATCLYLPGLLIILASTVPHLLGETFNTTALSVGLLFLWPTGTGVVKSIVNVFGARQFHPLLQSSLIESYYVSFYMCINVGAILGGVAVPVVAQHDVTLAYTFPVAMLALGVFLFLMGTPRYVRHSPRGELFSKKVSSNGADSTIGLATIFSISALVIPFNIAYSQMSTVFIIQGTAMQKAFGFIDAATMNNADAVAVLFFGYLVGSKVYPGLAERGIRIPTSYKFALGSLFGVASIGWAIFIEYKIRATYEATGDKLSIMWQALSYILIGAGEIFAVSAAYEVAFTSSPPDKKVLFSAVNLFCVGGLPSVLCVFLYFTCSSWFLNARGNASISKVSDYTTAHVDYYFWVLFVVAMLGVIINLLPWVRDYVASVEEAAVEMIKTPLPPKGPPQHKRMWSGDSIVDEDDSPMVRVKRHNAYLKYGSGPVLFKQGSMRTGPPSLSQRDKTKNRKSLSASALARLYRSATHKPQKPRVLLSEDGQPVRAGNLRRQDSL